jgi:hypothetical protein
MPNGLAPQFPCQIHRALQNFAFKPHIKMYTLKLLVNCVAHLTFHVSKLKLFLRDEQRPYQKQKVWSKVHAIEHRLVAEIKSILHTKQTCLKIEEYLVKCKCCHHKEIMWMKPIHLDHLLEMVNKFEQEKGHKLGVKRTQRVQAICFVHTCYLVFYLKAPRK